MIWLIIVALFTVGTVLMIAEIAIIPGFGAAGIAALLLIASGVAVAWYHYGAAWGLGSLAMAALMATATMVATTRSGLGGRLVLDTAITSRHADGVLAPAVGRFGVALTDLRPAGAVEIDGHRIDAVTDGKFIAAGTLIRVASVENARILVEEREA